MPFGSHVGDQLMGREYPNVHNAVFARNIVLLIRDATIAIQIFHSFSFFLSLFIFSGQFHVSSVAPPQSRLRRRIDVLLVGEQQHQHQRHQSRLPGSARQAERAETLGRLSRVGARVHRRPAQGQFQRAAQRISAHPGK